MRPGYKFNGLLLMTASTLTCSPLFAADEAASKRSGLEEVVVTAQRREERLQDVPIAITSISADQMTAAGVSSTTDIQNVTPGLIMPRALKGLTPYLRGVGSSVTSAAAEAPVATYVDGIYYMSPNGNLFSFNNVDRIEVLKGPQGTLFGRNATGGLINVITRDPQEEASIEGTVSYGKYETLESSLYATGGTEKVAGNIAFHVKHQGDGFGDYLFVGNKDAGFERNWGVQTKVLFRPSDDDRITLSLDYTKDDGDFGTVYALTPGMVHQQGITKIGGDYDSQNNIPTDADSEYYGGSVKWVHDFNSASFTSTTAVRQLDIGVLFDLDRTQSLTAGVNAFVPDNSLTVQQEFLLSGSFDRFDYTVGLFYFYADATIDGQYIFPKPTQPTQNVRTDASQVTDSYAAFAQGTYAITSSTHLTAGVRYTVDERDFKGVSTASPGNTLPVGTITAQNAGNDTWSEPTWRLAIDQQLTENVMVYASYNRGFKSGGFNTSAITQPPVNPETLDAYEIGIKTELFDRIARLNVSAFYYDYQDIQLARVLQLTPTSVPVQITVNAAAATIQGGEVEFEISPPLSVGELTINASASYIDGQYDSFPDAPTDVALPGTCAAPNAPVVPTGGFRSCPGDASGNDLVRTPEYGFNVGATYRFPVGAGEIDMSASYYYNNGFAWTPDNNLTQPSYTLLNAQVGYGFGADLQHRVFIFGTNLTDERYQLQRVRGGTGESGVFAQPLMWGGGLSFKF